MAGVDLRTVQELGWKTLSMVLRYSAAVERLVPTSTVELARKLARFEGSPIQVLDAVS